MLSKKAFGIGIARILARLDEMPSTTNEIIRVADVSPSEASSMLYYLKRKGKVDFVEFNMEVQTDSDIAEEGRYYKFKLWYNVKKYDERLIERRKKDLITMSRIGGEIVRMFENALYEACWYFYGAESEIEQTPYEEGLNDVYVHKRKLAFDIVTHFENPLKSLYLVKKHAYLPLGYKWHVISSCGWILDDAWRYAWRHDIGLHSLNIDGFPIFKKHERYRRIFERSGRKVAVIGYYDLLRDLEDLLGVIESGMGE